MQAIKDKIDYFQELLDRATENGDLEQIGVYSRQVNALKAVLARYEEENN